MNGMQKEEPNIDVRLAAATAFQNAMDFFKPHFAQPVFVPFSYVLQSSHDKHHETNFVLFCCVVQQERDYMMTVTCEATQAADPRMKTAALQCMVRIVQLYYRFMEPYMAPALLPVSHPVQMYAGILLS